MHTHIFFSLRPTPFDKGKANGNGNGAKTANAAASSRAPPPGFAPPSTTKAPVPNAWATPLPAVATPVGFSGTFTLVVLL
jgi:hypothetical protein